MEHQDHHQGQQNQVQEELNFTEDTSAATKYPTNLETSVIFTNETNMITDITEGGTIMTVDDDGNGYYFGVLLALGAAVSGSASNVIVAKVEEISSTSLCTYRY